MSYVLKGFGSLQDSTLLVLKKVIDFDTLQAEAFHIPLLSPRFFVWI